MKIKDLPLELRPREKAIKYGIDTLSDVELIAIILGNGTKEANVLMLAENVLNVTGGLNGLMHSSFLSLMKIPGIKTAKALSLASLISIYQRVDLIPKEQNSDSIESIIEKYQKKLFIDKQEKLILVTLNRFKRIIKETLMGLGNDSSVNVSAREIFKEIYLNNGYGFYLIHTHPNCISYPSSSDILATERLLSKSKRLNIHFENHFVIGLNGVSSVMDYINRSNYFTKM